MFPAAASLRAHSGLVTSLAFSPDGKSLASAASDSPVSRELRTWKLWHSAAWPSSAKEGRWPQMPSRPRRSRNPPGEEKRTGSPLSRNRHFRPFGSEGQRERQAAGSAAVVPTCLSRL
jgi:WD40 repeat protein